jgi:integrating conjugative element protein (TIGR03761 family)
MSEQPLIETVDDDREHPGHSVGSLRGEVWLTVQTYQAQSLVHGRRSGDGKPAIVGLVGFADRLKTLWQAARQNDPYADWWLIKIEESIALCREQLNQLFEQFSQLLASHYSFQVTIAESSKPQRIALQFANPYAFRAAQMLAEFDRLICTVMTARHLGVATPQALNEQFEASGRWLRRVFALPQGYHFCDIDRNAVNQGTLHARNARDRMGPVPDDIMYGRQLPSLRPIPFRDPSPLLPATGVRSVSKESDENPHESIADTGRMD